MKAASNLRARSGHGWDGAPDARRSYALVSDNGCRLSAFRGSNLPQKALKILCCKCWAKRPAVVGKMFLEGNTHALDLEGHGIVEKERPISPNQNGGRRP